MKERTSNILRNHFSATNIAYMALFTALAFVVSLLEFPLFPAAPYLKLDFANVFFLFEGFLFGPVEAVVSILIKELLCFAKTSSGGVGELANFILSTAYILIPALVYRFKKGRWWVALYLGAACVLQTAVSLPVNRYINFPFFMGDGAAAAFEGAWYFVLAFNAIKSVLVSLVVFFVYKPLSRLIKLTRDRLDRKLRRSHSPSPDPASDPDLSPDPATVSPPAYKTLDPASDPTTVSPPADKTLDPASSPDSDNMSHE